MNTQSEILEVVANDEAGRLGIIPADRLAPWHFA